MSDRLTLSKEVDMANRVDGSEWLVPAWAAWLATFGLGIAILGIIGRIVTGEQNYDLAASIGFAIIFAALAFAKKRKI